MPSAPSTAAKRPARRQVHPARRPATRAHRVIWNTAAASASWAPVPRGTASAPTLAYFVDAEPDVLWKAGVATALFVAGFGVAGYSTRRDLAPLARVLLWALIALIAFGIILVFVELPG